MSAHGWHGWSPMHRLAVVLGVGAVYFVAAAIALLLFGITTTIWFARRTMSHQLIVVRNQYPGHPFILEQARACAAIATPLAACRLHPGEAFLHHGPSSVAGQCGGDCWTEGRRAPISRLTHPEGRWMTTFDDRERAFETKFAHDEDMKFRMIARRNRLLGEWAARQMGLSEAETEAYAKDVIRADFEEAGDEDVIRKVLGDLTAAGVETDDSAIREALGHKEVEARRQIIEATNL